MDYLDSLELLKTSLMGGTEVGTIAKLIEVHHQNSKNITWLDIGIGDGRSLKKS